MNAKYEQKHTEGPWQADAISGREYQIVVRAADGYPAAIAQGEFSPEAQANAHLIAAAPDLLRELKRLTLIVHPDEMNRYPGVKAECLAAIAKAEGRQA